jgi:tetratricopeptide (TPR) repeat protein
MVSPDDTQPRSPFPGGRPPVTVTMDDDERPGGPGCLALGCIGGLVAAFALAIIGLSAFAGWTSGQRTAQTNATATQDATIKEQLARIPVEANTGNLFLLRARIEYLATLTPGVPNLADYIQTATAVYLTSQPTPTPMPSPTLAATATPGITPTAPAAPLVTPAASVTPGAGVNLPVLLDQARSAVATQDYAQAIKLLDVIIAADDKFQAALVRELMYQALKERALKLFRFGTTGDLAEAILLTDRIKQFGDPGELNYESFIASQYLDALNSIGVSFPVSIAALQRVYSQAPGYRDVGRLLNDQYVKYGDAWVAGGDYCPAVGPYQNALALFNDPGVAAKRNDAQTRCAQATPLGGATVLPGTIAPVGQQ